MVLDFHIILLIIYIIYIMGLLMIMGTAMEPFKNILLTFMLYILENFMKNRRGYLLTVKEYENSWATSVNDLYFHIYTGNTILKNQYCHIIKLFYEK